MQNRIENSNTIIQNEMAKPYNTLLIDSLIEEEKGLDNSYIGKVVDNKDPDKIGRCKIKVFGLFDEVADDDLPWAIGEQGFVGSLVGSFIVPPIGCIVSVSFENGDIYFPKYSNKVVDKSKLPKSRSKNYPDNMIFFETDEGSSFEIDRSNEDITFKHKSGSKVKFKIDGSTGKLTVNAGEVEINNSGTTALNGTSINLQHSLMLSDNGSFVIPDPTGGPFCALITCPYSGMPLQGKKVMGMPYAPSLEIPEVYPEISFSSDPAEEALQIAASDAKQAAADGENPDGTPIVYDDKEPTAIASDGALVTAGNINALFPQNKTPKDLADIMNFNFPKYDIVNKQRIAAFLSQAGHESNGFTVMKENLNYSADGLRKIFGKYFKDVNPDDYAKKPEKIANRVYANRMGNGDEASGDGYKFRGRGYIQLTGKDNYTKFGKSLSITNLDEVIKYIETPTGALESALWFWYSNKLNAIADTGNVEKTTRRINGGTIGLEDRQRLYDLAMRIIATPQPTV